MAAVVFDADPAESTGDIRECKLVRILRLQLLRQPPCGREVASVAGQTTSSQVALMSVRRRSVCSAWPVVSACA